MDKNLLLAVSLSIAVYALWFGVIEKRYMPPAAPAATAPAINGANSISNSSNAEAAGAAPVPATAPAETAEARQKIIAGSDSFNFGKARIRIARKGAAIVSAQYPEPLGVVELIEDPTPGFFATWPEINFQKDSSSDGIVYIGSLPNGLKIRKEFVPVNDQTLPQIRMTLTNPTGKALDSGQWTLSVGPGLGTIASEQKENIKVWRALGLLYGENGLNGKIEVFKKPDSYQQPFQWVGVDNRYFLAAVIPAADAFGAVQSALPPEIALSARNVTIPPHSSHSWALPFYLGAKGMTRLASFHHGLERSVNFGFFTQLGRFVMNVLYRIHEVVGNWGWSIIILTVLIQVVLFPFTYKSLKSMAAMKRLQPEIAKLQQRYAKDAGKLNSETMALYKKNGANPLGGCLPMLVQLPIFYALYNALRNAWELHGAGWIFWIKDLSVKDPYYVLPLFMGAVMFAQNKMNPAATDPTQAQMMMFMPIIFTFMFLNFPAGLVLYWMTNSLASLLLQVALRNRLGMSGKPA